MIEKILLFKSELDRTLTLERMYKPFDLSQETSERLMQIVAVLLRKHGLEIEFEDIFENLNGDNLDLNDRQHRN